MISQKAGIDALGLQSIATLIAVAIYLGHTIE
jgi:hypothetical protein